MSYRAHLYEAERRRADAYEVTHGDRGKNKNGTKQNRQRPEHSETLPLRQFNIIDAKPSTQASSAQEHSTLLSVLHHFYLFTSLSAV
ncbi:hypothetical protein [Photobacterium sp. GSS17]|uniref:hypothetical protein n=1 Tax=Photobacterium sp. GSS17 TaxID=3020715 RepID=UPI00235E4655|nr:hypothetical protein [Photobacterium sp. GSS17]